jgi:polygalacturonase
VSSESNNFQRVAATSEGARPRRFAVRRRTAVVAALALAGLSLAGTSSVAAGATKPDRGIRSTSTVVVAKEISSRILWNVGTSRVTAQPGATVRQVLGQLVASDRSKQSREIVDEAGTVKRSGPVKPGDRLVVLAEDGRSTGSYELGVHDPLAAERDGVYWNEPLYDWIDRTVNAHTPVFPDRRCDITSARYAPLVRAATEAYAAGNAADDPAQTASPLVFRTQQVWFYGDVINAAVRDCHAAGGGIVVIPPRGSRNAGGAYYSGSITLLSGVELRIETGAVVKFMRNKTNEYYPVVRTSYEGTDLYSFSPLIYALHQRDIAVSGGGTLDGQEDMWNWRPWKKGYWGEPSVENKSLDAPYGENGILNRMNFEDVPIEERIFTDDGHLPATIPVVHGDSVRQVPPPPAARPMSSTFRPSFIETNDSEGVLIEDVQIRNTPFWIVHPLSSRNVLIRDLDIYSNKTTDFERTGWNNDDGLDPESSSNVVLERNRVIVSDDGGAIKSGRNVNGREHRAPAADIIIRDSMYGNDGGGSAAISMGSEMSGGIRNVFIHGNTFGGPGLAMALKIKTNSTRGGVVENIYLRDSVLRQASRGLVELDGNYSETVPFPNTDIFDPKIRDIYLDNVNTEPTMPRSTTTFSFPSAASRSPVENVHYRNSGFHTTSTLAAGFSRNKNIKNLVVDDVTYINPDTGAITRYDTKPLNLLDRTAAVLDSGQTVRLTAASTKQPDLITTLPTRAFQVSGALDLSTRPSFPTTGEIRIFLDRAATPIAAHLQPDGTFLSDPLVLDDNQGWYRDRHYVSVNFDDGIDINTAVYQVAARADSATAAGRSAGTS